MSLDCCLAMNLRRFHEGLLVEVISSSDGEGNIIQPTAVQAAIGIAGAILAEASMSFPA